MENTQDSVLADGIPWLIFQLNRKKFALSCGYVNAIFTLQSPITPVSQYPDMVRGVMNLRGQIVPMLEMRKFFQQPTLENEYQVFANMLEQRKQDHILWVDELTRCVETGDKFALATDPHKCAFGKWYDTASFTHPVVQHHMKQIDAPHKALHSTAEEALACKRECDTCKRHECLKSALHNAAEIYMPQVVALLEEAKEVFRLQYREMGVVMVDGDKQLGLIVDEVLAVAPVSPAGDPTDFELFNRSDAISHIVHSDAVPGEILALEPSALFGLIS